MNAIYSAEDNSLTEQPNMAEPRPPFGGIFSDYWEIHKKKMLAYKKEVAACRTIPCHDSCRGLWKEGDVLMEGEDYKVGPFNVGEFKPKVLAYPLVPVKSEDDPYEELVTMIARSSWDRNEIIAEAKKQFIVTKR